VLEFVLIGEVDLARRDELDAIIDKVEMSDAAYVVVDLAEVSFLDSTGLRMLVLLSVMTSAREGRVHVLRPQRPVRRALQISGVEQLVDIVDDAPPCAADPSPPRHLHPVE
jgi:anti-anti-sigma factor